MKSYRQLLIALGLLLGFPMIALAQAAPTPSNPSYSTQTKFGYGRFTQNLEVDGLLQMAVGTGGSILGGTNYASFEVSALGQNTMLNFSDPGAATANVLLDSGTTSAITIQHVTVPLTSTQLLGMSATPVQLIAAGAAGTNIVVHHAMFTMNRTSTAYASGGTVVIQSSNTATGGGTAVTGTIASTVLTTAGAATTYNVVIPVAFASAAATGIFISNQTGPFTTGTGTAVVDLWYSVK